MEHRTTAEEFAEDAIEAAVAAERERIAAAIDHEADVCPCAEDAKVLRDTARLVRADFSYDDAEKLAEAGLTVERSQLCRKPDGAGRINPRCQHIIEEPREGGDARQCRAAAESGSQFCGVHRPAQALIDQGQRHLRGAARDCVAVSDWRSAMTEHTWVVLAAI